MKVSFVLFIKVDRTGPIYKSGSHREPQNYRGVSLMNSISKIFNGILTARVQNGRKRTMY